MHPDLRFAIDTDHADFTVLSVEGEIDIYTAPVLRQKLVELADGGPPRLVVDLDPVEFLDSTGLGVLVAALNRARRQDGDVELVCSQARILRVFEITGLTEVFVIHASREAAVAGAAA